MIYIVYANLKEKQFAIKIIATSTQFYNEED